MRWYAWLSWLIAVAIAALIWVWLFSGSSSLFGAVAQATPTDWTQLTAGYAATVVGVIMGQAYRALHPSDNETGRIDSFRTLASDIFRSRSLWAGLVASPLVFGLLYRSLDGVALSGLVVLGMENGFCCHTVVSNIKIGGR